MKVNFGPILITLTFALLLVGCDNATNQQGSANQQPQELTIVTWGGSYQAAQEASFFEPFENENNVKIRIESYSGDIAKVKAMVESGEVTWDIVDVEGPILLRGISEGLYEPIDMSLMPVDELLPEAVNEYGIAVIVYSTVMGYNTEHYANGGMPQSWAEYWDVESFPGPRSLRNWPMGNLEFALLADGVTAADLYPLDIDRAFASLDKIKPHIDVWWETGEQAPQLISSGEVVLGSGFNGRLFNAKKDGKPVAEMWNGGMIDADYWVVVKGSKNKDLAMKFIAFASQAKQQEEMPNHISYGPVNIKASAALSDDVAKDLPTYAAHLPNQFFVNKEWWDENFDAIMERWQQWLLE
jgi:putative spermidine/putrescine transport system substrate-binding protein